MRPAPRLRTAVAALLAVTACARPAPQPEHGKVVIGVSVLRISQPVFAAAERGLFAKHGLQVELRKFDTAQPLADELATGRIDAGGYVAFPILFGRPAPPRVRVLTAVVEDAEHPLSFLLAKKGGGLRGVAALKGKKVGILPTAAYQRWLEAILAEGGLTAADVSVIPVAPGLQVDTLAGGGIDALFTGDPMATAALTRGVAEPVTSTPDVPRVLGTPFLFGTFAITERLATERPGAARALRAALDEAIGVLAGDAAVGPAVMKAVVRDSERAFVAHYPPSRYLTSAEVAAPALARALELAGSKVSAADLAAP